MSESAIDMRRFRGIAFVGSYLPRACGIATFTHDLAEAVAREAGEDQPVIVAAMNDVPEGYSYPDRVKFEVRQDYQLDYCRAADFLNLNNIDVVSLQHEYGIYGSDEGSNVLALLRDLHRPLVVTCHTVLEKPEPRQQEIFVEIAARAEKLVVMSRRAIDFLVDGYGLNRDKIALIPHGLHDVSFIDPSYFKDKFGVEGRRVLLSFGLLHRNKGVEYMIDALPAIIERHPRTTYVVLGATHPAVVRMEGEAYRLGLRRKVRELGLEEHVMFHARFTELAELLEYLGAADIVVTSYLQLDQITSGALVYAMGAGKAVVSTPYWHAEELLADDRGCLVPVRDSEALAREIIDLLDDEVALSAMRKRAYQYCRSMIWPEVARSYLELFDEVRRHVPRIPAVASSMRRPIAAPDLPLPKLNHLFRLSDDTGPSHHARHTIPDWSFGYKLEDAATALVVCVKYCHIFTAGEALRLAETCLTLLQTLVGDSGTVAERLDYSRRRTGRAPDVAIGKAIWALGYVVWRGPSLLVEPAHALFHQTAPASILTTPRGVSYAILGAANYLMRFPGASEVRRRLDRQLERLHTYCDELRWIERWGGPDWAVAAQALAVAGRILDSEDIRRRAATLIDELRAATEEGTLFLRRLDDPDEEELPTTAATFVEALGAAYQDRRDPDLLPPIRSAADWFLGANRVGESLYDFSTGGCHDALGPTGLNRNQGTEATVFCLLAFLTLHHLSAIDVPREPEQ